MAELERQAQFEAALTDEVYNAAWRYAWRLAASRRGGSYEEAEDLLAEALAHAWRQFGQLRDHSSFRSWLMSIVRTRYVDRLRRMRRRPQTVEELPEPPAALVEQADGTLAEALDRLRADERELLELFYLEQLSLAELGAAVGLSERVVRQRLYRARLHLRSVLDTLLNPAGSLATSAGRTERTLR